MSTLYSTGFGSDEFFRTMKYLWAADREEAAKLLKEQAEQICRLIIWKYKGSFTNVTEEDFEDYAAEAWIRMWQDMERFLSDPRNDPDSDGPHYTPEQKISWAKKLIRFEMLKLRDRKMGKNLKGANGKPIIFVYLDQPLDDTGMTSFGSTIPSNDPELGQTDEEVELVANVLQEFFRLPNNSETLAAVAYVILNEEFGEKQSMEKYADQLSKDSVIQIVEKMENILAGNEMNPEWLLPFRRRIEKEGGDRPFSDLTAVRLTNRKSEVKKALKGRMGRQGHKGMNRIVMKGE